jgi:catechol 2,3-dioxygenase-like lactoylglutathione lyase family enzyme
MSTTSPIQFGYVILYVQDVKAALTFYENAFGVAQRFFHESGMYGELETGATALAFAHEEFTPTANLIELSRASKKAAAAEVAFVVPDVAAAYAKALAAGATPAVEPVVKPWGQTVAYVRDPSGFLVELCTKMG